MGTKNFLARAMALSASKGIQDGFISLLLLWLARTDQSGYGLFMFGIGVAAMIRSVLALGLDQYSLREFSFSLQGRGEVLARIVRIKIILGGLILAGLALFGFLKGWNNTQSVVVLAIAVGQVMDGLAESFFNLFRAEGRQVREGGFRAGANLVGALYGAACLLLGLGVTRLVFFLVICNGLKLLVAVVGARRLKLTPTLTNRGGLLPAGQAAHILLFAGVSVLGSFYNYIQIFLLKQFQPLSEVAFYGAAYDLTSGFSGLVSQIIIGAVLFPSLVAAADQGKEQLAGRLREYFRQLIIYGMGVVFFLGTLGGWFLPLLYGSPFQAAVLPLKILAPATLLSFVNNMAIYAFMAMRQERRLLLFHLVPAGVSLLLGLLLIPVAGAVGAAGNLLACRFVMTVIIISQLHRHLPFIKLKALKPVFVGGLAWGGVYFVLGKVQPVLAAIVALIVYGLVVRYYGVRGNGD
ncbi:MAG: polysaccharide biosynthesis C-terminal domain-containing protein [Desulfobacterales bacterium]|nr:polysaccharide biosynthesis C-terminal domain-containing protein [Desulfobacterales bacterium]